MANRREEERERLRQARKEREHSAAGSERRRLMLGYGVAGVIGLAVLIGIVVAIVSAASKNGGGNAHIVQASGSTNGIQPDERAGADNLPPLKVTNLQKAAEQAGCDLRLRLEDEGHTHLSETAATPEYKTNPPTSGNHVEPPYQQADGAYSEMPDEMDLVHSLEHGRMQIQYSPDLPESEQLELVGLYDTMFGATLLFPNENMPYEVAATTWTNLIGCNEFKGAITLDAIRDFGKVTWGKYGGEPVSAFPYNGPTPVAPAIN